MAYHINNKGETGFCKAEKQCPFGDAEQHYSSAEAARAAFEETNAANVLVSNSIEFWDANELEASIATSPALHGVTLQEIRDNVKLDFEEALQTKTFDTRTFLMAYGMIPRDAEPEDYELTFGHNGSSLYAVVSVVKTNSSNEPFENVANLISQNKEPTHDLNNSSASIQKYFIKLKPSDEAKGRALYNRAALKESYANLSNKEYPNWMVLPAKEPMGAGIHPAALTVLRNAHIALQEVTKASSLAASNASVLQKYSQRITELDKKKAEVEKTIAEASSPESKKALLAEIDSLNREADSQRYSLSSESDLLASKARKIRLDLTTEEYNYEKAQANLREAAETFAIKILANRHPSTKKARALSQAKEWVRNHPNLVNSILKNQRSSWE